LSGKIVVVHQKLEAFGKAMEPRLRELKLELRENYHHPKSLSITKSQM
jgi:hypothetical protein